MHKKLESELMSIAHSILKMQNKDDVKVLQEKAKQLYEKLSVLVFVDDYLMTTPTATETKSALISKIEKAQYRIGNPGKEEEFIAETVADKTNTVEEVLKEEKAVSTPGVKEEVIENKEQEKEEQVQAENTNEVQLTLEDEFKDAISVDVTADLFQKIPQRIKKEKTNPEKNEAAAVADDVVEKEEVVVAEVKSSLNDRLQQNLQIGLNDRIAFVKHLFNGDQGDFNRVISQINTMKNYGDAKSFVLKMVKLDYNWEGKEEYEERLLALVERKFL